MEQLRQWILDAKYYICRGTKFCYLQFDKEIQFQRINFGMHRVQENTCGEFDMA